MNKSTYFLLALGILSAFTLICFLLPDQATQSMRKGTMGVLGPVLRTVDKPAHFFSRVDSKLKTLDEAQMEVAKLRMQVAELTVQNQVLTDKGTENARLREMLGFSRGLTLSPARLPRHRPGTGHVVGNGRRQRRGGRTIPTWPRTSRRFAARCHRQDR